MNDRCSNGSKTAGEMHKLASELNGDEVDGDYNKLSPEWKLIFELHMARKGIDKDEFIKILEGMHVGKSKSAKKTNEMKKLASLLDDDDIDGDYNKLSPEWKLIFELHMARKKMDEDDFIEFLNDLRDSTKKGGDMQTVAAAFSRVFDEDLGNDVKASYNAFSSEVTSHIIPHLDDDESEKYETLSKQYANQSELLSKMKSCQTRRSSYGKGMKNHKTNATGRKRKGNDGIGSGSKKDKRMKAAVEAKLENPNLNHYQALTTQGGFDFGDPPLNKTGRCIGEPKGPKSVKDEDGKNYQYRKDKLKEALKWEAERQAAKKKGRSFTARGGTK